MKLCHVVKYTIYGHVKLGFQCYFKCIYLDLAVVNIVDGGIDMVDTTICNQLKYYIITNFPRFVDFILNKIIKISIINS
jgi:hypothetical protein